MSQPQNQGEFRVTIGTQSSATHLQDVLKTIADLDALQSDPGTTTASLLKLVAMQIAALRDDLATATFPRNATSGEAGQIAVEDD